MVKSIVSANTLRKNHMEAVIKSFLHKIKIFKEVEPRYIGVYFEIHVVLDDPEAEKIPTIIMKPEKEPEEIKGPLINPSVYVKRLQRLRHLADAYKILMKKVLAEGRRILAAHKGKCRIIIVRKKMNPANKQNAVQ